MRRNHAHVAQVEVMELAVREVLRGVIEHVAHRQLLGTERLLVGIRLEG